MKLFKIRNRRHSAWWVVTASSLILCCVGCTRPRQTTAVGSGVGGAIGAGLGAIVGNQSGNAGSGLAIGAAAGAATGALIGNALQAQEERATSTQEAMKRQERTIQAQKSEIAELRAMQSDTGTSLSVTNTPRYRYRQPSMDPESPEVARQRARLQQRGPRPSSGSSRSSYYDYEAPRPSPAARAPISRVSEKTGDSRKPLARYDVRGELSESLPSSRSSVVRQAPQAASKSSAPKTPSNPKDHAVKESDLPVVEPVPAKLSSPPSAQSGECKEALSERDLAHDASENSDKLYHLRRALRLCPHNAPLHFELGQVYASMQRRSDAEGEYKEALRIDPNLPAAKKAMSELLKDEVQF